MSGSPPEARSLRAATRPGSALPAEHGFTLVELIVAMVIVVLVFGAFSLLITSAINDSSTITNDSALQTEARSTLDEMTDALRQAYPLTSSATCPFVTCTGTMSSSSISFYTPARTYSSIAPTTFNLEELSYQLSGSKLQVANATSTNSSTPSVGGWTLPALGTYETEVTNVTGLTFSYVTSSGTSTTNPALVNTVNVSLTLKDPAGQSFTFVDSASLRVDE